MSTYARAMSLIACYCRVSTRHQKNDSQRAEIERWLEHQPVNRTTVRWFEDKESGTTLRRLAFEAMQRGLLAGTIKTVVVWKLDRLSRRQRDGINLLADWGERGVRVVAVTQHIDLNGTVGWMVASVLFGLAEIEMDYRRERQGGRDCGGQTARALRGTASRNHESQASAGESPPPARPDGYRNCPCPGRQPAYGFSVFGPAVRVDPWTPLSSVIRISPGGFESTTGGLRSAPMT